jgi:hypothetical protein
VGSKSARIRDGSGNDICCPSAFAPLKEKSQMPTAPFKTLRDAKPKAAP